MVCVCGRWGGRGGANACAYAHVPSLSVTQATQCWLVCINFLCVPFKEIPRLTQDSKQLTHKCWPGHLKIVVLRSLRVQAWKHRFYAKIVKVNRSSAKRFASRSEDQGTNPAFLRGSSPVTWKLVMLWLPCQAPGVLGCGQGPAGPIRV